MRIWIAIYVFAYWPLLAVAWAWSLRFGRSAVRSVATVLLVGTVAEWLTTSHRAWSHLEAPEGLIDLAVLVWLMVLTTRAPRLWLMLVTALQVFPALGHLAKLFEPRISRLAYAILVGGGSYLQVALLVCGLITASRNRRPRMRRPVRALPDDTPTRRGEAP